jgi:predicted permease
MELQIILLDVTASILNVILTALFGVYIAHRKFVEEKDAKYFSKLIE